MLVQILQFFLLFLHQRQILVEIALLLLEYGYFGSQDDFLLLHIPNGVLLLDILPPESVDLLLKCIPQLQIKLIIKIFNSFVVLIVFTVEFDLLIPPAVPFRV